MSTKKLNESAGKSLRAFIQKQTRLKKIKSILKKLPILMILLFTSCHVSKEYKQIKKTTKCEYEKYHH